MNYKRYFIFVGYVVISLLIGKEFYPFSRFPMYDRFPNWSYVFYMQNEHGEVLPFNRYFTLEKSAGNVAHNFYIYFNSKNYPYGYGKEDPVHLQNAGESLMAMIIKNEPIEKFGFDSLKLYRRFYYLDNNQIKYRDDLMYVQPVRQ